MPSFAPSNLLVLMSDQHNRLMMGCAGHPDVKTPNLDALAARGTRFANAYTNSPICVPSRAAMATGRYPHQIGVWDNAAPYTGRPASWGHRLTAAGRHVTTIGKLHLPGRAGRHRLPGPAASRCTATRASATTRGCSGRTCRRDSSIASTCWRPAPATPSTSATTGRSATEAVRWLREEARDHADAPWALFASFVCPHPPFIAPPEFMALYDPEKITLPVGWRQEEWVHHPALDLRRKIMFHEEPLDERDVPPGDLRLLRAGQLHGRPDRAGAPGARRGRPDRLHPHPLHQRPRRHGRQAWALVQGRHVRGLGRGLDDRGRPGHPGRQGLRDERHAGGRLPDRPPGDRRRARARGRRPARASRCWTWRTRTAAARGSPSRSTTPACRPAPASWSATIGTS